MSIEYLNSAFTISLTGVKKSVLIALADRANHSGYCYPSLDDIAFRSGCSKRSAIRAVSELEILGFLAVVRGQGKLNKYILLLENLSTSSDTETPEKDIHSGDTMAQTSDMVSKNWCHGVTQTIINHQEPYRHQKTRKQNHGILTNSGAYKIHESEPSKKPNKKIVSREMKHIRDLLIPAGSV